MRVRPGGGTTSFHVGSVNWLVHGDISTFLIGQTLRHALIIDVCSPHDACAIAALCTVTGHPNGLERVAPTRTLAEQTYPFWGANLWVVSGRLPVNLIDLHQGFHWRLCPSSKFSWCWFSSSVHGLDPLSDNGSNFGLTFLEELESLLVSSSTVPGGPDLQSYILVMIEHYLIKS